MTTYSDAELAAMMSDLESDVVERQESLGGDAPNKIREAVCAFANDLRDAVLGEAAQAGVTLANDPHCLAALKHFRSLMPLAQEARKPMFALKAADGAIGGHAKAVQECDRDFRALAREIARRTGIALP